MSSESNKLLCAILSALLIYLLASFLSEILYNKEHIIKYYENNNYPDERVYITALDQFGLGNEIKNMCVTYCNWLYKSSHPIDFTTIRKKNLYSLLKSDCLFARKFTSIGKYLC